MCCSPPTRYLWQSYSSFKKKNYIKKNLLKALISTSLTVLSNVEIKWFSNICTKSKKRKKFNSCRDYMDTFKDNLFFVVRSLGFNCYIIVPLFRFNSITCVSVQLLCIYITISINLLFIIIIYS